MIKLLSFRYCVAMSFLMSGMALFSQPELLSEYGDIDPEWVSQDGIDTLPEADAVILFDIGVVSFEMLDRSPKVQYEYHRRIKIITEAGKAYGRVRIPISKGVDDEILTSLKASSYSFNVEGEMVEFPLDKRRIRQEKKRRDQNWLEFKIPFVKEGAIIEYRYIIKSPNFAALRTWNFQQELPILHSEYHALIPDVYEYLPIIRGDNEQITQYVERFQRAPILDRPRSWTGSMSGFNRQGYFENNLVFSGDHYIYVMENLEPSRKERFSLVGDSYGPSVSLELAQTLYNRRQQSGVYDNWSRLNKQMLRRYSQRRLRFRPRNFKSKAQNIAKAANSDVEQLNLIYQHVRTKWDWDGEYGLKPGNLNQVYERQVGTGVELNLILLYLLREIGVEANPVLLSTRDYGRPLPIYPTLGQFNHLIISADVEGERLLLDAVSEHEILGMLPSNDLNSVGYRLDQAGGGWIKIKSRNKINQVTYSRFDLGLEGELTGQVFVENRDYSAILEQAHISELNHQTESYLREHVFQGMKDSRISAPKVREIQDEETLIVSCELATQDFVDVSGEYMFIKPMLNRAVTANPFMANERNTPVDLPYPVQDSHMLGLRIPKGLVVAQLPQPIRVVMPNNAGSFTYNVLEMDNILHFTSTIQINQTTFMPHEYLGIKSFFEYVVSKHQEDIVLKRLQ